MPRKPSVWFWEQRNQYCTTIGGRRHLLGPEKTAAERQFHALLAKPEPRVPSNTVVAIVDLFLEWTQQHREPLTYIWYKRHLQSFVDSLPRSMQVDRLRAHHIDSWIDSHKGWGNSYRRGAITAVARCFNWALKKDHIEQNPIWKKLEKPPATRREVVVSPAEFKRLQKHLKGDFRDLVVTGWETGCRPQEVRKVEARHVDLKQGRWVFPVVESKGKRDRRVVYLSDTALAITKRLVRKFPAGPLFRRKGKPWTGHDASQYFTRLQKAVGVRYRLYDFRHSFVTNGLKNGVDPITMQHLVGHTDLTMISKIYAHVSQDVKHMRKMASRAVATAK